MTSIHLENVTATYPNGVRAIDRVTLEIESGQLVVVAGPSGCGKTTLLRVIAGLKKADAGEVRFDGKNVNDVSPRQRNVAMVFQSDALYPHMSVERNMRFGVRLRSSRVEADRDTISSRIRATAKRLGMDGMLFRKPFQLSGGERQRVALGRILVREPAAFLLDEPLNQLDAVWRQELRNYIWEVQRSKPTTMVFVTHDQDDAMLLADKIVVMDRGIVQQVGSPREIYFRPANRFVAGFFGNPAMNFVAGELVNHQAAFNFSGGELELSLNRKTGLILNRPKPNREQPAAQSGTNGFAVELGVRPEHVSVDRSTEDELGAVDRNQESAMFVGSSPAVVKRISRTGRETFLEVKLVAGQNETNETSGAELVAIVDNGTEFETGQQVSISFDESKLYFFDTETGQAICLAE